MLEVIRQIPLPESLLQDLVANEIGYEVWDRADTLISREMYRPVAKQIFDYYSFGYYVGVVGNGGHSQLVCNMNADSSRLFKLSEGFMTIAEVIGAPQFKELARSFQCWLRENPNIAAEQTGFLGGRAKILDHLDAKFVELNEGFRPKLLDMKSRSRNSHAVEFLNECIDRVGCWNGDLNALEVVWLVDSDIIQPVPDEIYDETWNTLLS